jgi:BirA family biotin operon repressor/biotin-[acetyl-CoA-carboxylase] ligase
LPALSPIGKPFIELLTVESTNNYAMGLVRAAMAQHGATVFSHEQTKGRGQRSKEWVSRKGQNIALSVIIEPKEMHFSQPFLLSMMAAISVCEFLANYIQDQIKIKWPNDIYWRDRKAAGILIENVWQASEWKFAVIGIGININQTDFGGLEAKAVSIKQITGRDFQPVVLAKELCEMMEDKYQLLVSRSSQIVSQYKSQLYKINQQIKLKKENRIFEVEFKDVTAEGQMLVQHFTEEKFAVGEVEWIIS